MPGKKFKTNIKCSACVAKVTPALDQLLGEGNWSVDLQHPDRLLEVPDNTRIEALAEALTPDGYKAETANN